MGVVIPLYKKGDHKNCNNYRGVTLLSIVSKVYERILEGRLRKTLNRQLEESQRGFGKGRSTRDHIFTLKQIIEKKQLQGTNLYMAFVDIHKAFDSVPRRKIWKRLKKRGISEKLRNNIQGLYRVTGNYVRKDNSQSKEFVTM